jgi:RNA polymerase sigma-70 factor (ECF subfamily)
MKNIIDDTELVKGIIAGRESDFEALYNRYKEKLYAYSSNFTKSREFTDDIASEVFVKVWLIRRKLDPSLPFSALLFKMTKNIALNLLEKNSRLDALHREYQNYVDQATNNTEDEVVSSNYAYLLNKAVDLLPLQQKRVFKLHKLDGMSYKEISSILHISTGTVKNHMILALKFIRNQIGTDTDLFLPR